MAEYLSPGMQVEEFEAGGRPAEGVSTATAGFVGLAVKGPVGGNPQPVTNFADFRRTFGGYLPEHAFGESRYLSYAVEHFFTNGGKIAFISRVAPADAVKAKSQGGTPVMFQAQSPGEWGNELRIIATPFSKANTQILKLISPKQVQVKSAAGFHAGDVVAVSGGESPLYNRVLRVQNAVLDLELAFPPEVVDTAPAAQKMLATCEFTLEIKHDESVELYEVLSFNVNAPNHILKKLGKSALVTVELGNIPDAAVPPMAVLTAGNEADVAAFRFRGGSNGTVSQITPDTFIGTDWGPGARSGIQAFLDNSTVSVIAVPGIMQPKVQLALAQHCEKVRSRFAVLDMPKDAKGTDGLIAHRDKFDSSYAAFYHPWLIVYDPLGKGNITIPPSGAVMGIFARTDTERGVHKAPANEVVRGCLGLNVSYNKSEQDILNPKGVNLIHSFPGQGIRIWGARTASSNSLWKYVNVRRLFIYVEESIKANTNWVVFEPNDEVLWMRVQRTIDVFLNTVWRSGALMGSSPEEAFYVKVGRSTMSQGDIDNGRLIIEIGIAPVKPSEFTPFRITQKTAS